MTRWGRGVADIEQLVNSGELQQVTGSQANGEKLLERARRAVASAAEIVDSDPNSAYVLAYDSARYAGTALLAQQGLRPTSRGGHYAVESALRAQFGDGFRAYATMRRRRNELEYQSIADEETDREEALGAALLSPTIALLTNPSSSLDRMILRRQGSIDTPRTTRHAWGGAGAWYVLMLMPFDGCP